MSLEGEDTEDDAETPPDSPELGSAEPKSEAPGEEESSGYVVEPVVEMSSLDIIKA